MRERALIVGGTGFIGFNLIKKLSNKNFSITSISANKPRKNRKVKKVKYLKCDITKKKRLNKLLKNKSFDYIINLGGYVDHSNKKKTYESHYLGVKNLTQIFKNKKIKKFIQMGSSLENGKIKSPQEENYYTQPKNLQSTYGKSKLLSTLHLLKMFKNHDFPVTIFRLFQTYGPGQDPNRVISFTIENCFKNRKFPCSSGNQFRDFIFITDVIKIIILSLKNKTSNGKIYNLGLGKPIKIKKLILQINKIIKKGKPLFGKIKLRKDEKKYIYADTQKLKKDFNFKPFITIKKGIEKTIKNFNSNE